MNGEEKNAGCWSESRWRETTKKRKICVVDNIKMGLREMEYGVWNGLIWFRIETSGGLLLTRY
jgi:hypothetical protein